MSSKGAALFPEAFDIVDWTANSCACDDERIATEDESSLDCFSTVDKGSLAFAADDPNGVGDLHDRVLAEGGLMLAAVEDVTFAFEE